MAGTGADGIELNFGCQHGMSERGMGSAVEQVPEYIEMVTRCCKQNFDKPVIVKLTPKINDIRYPARAVRNGGADAVSLLNTVSSITSVNLDRFSPEPMIDGKGSHGGYCGPAVKPIALYMVAEIARDPETNGLPISGIGGATTWRDAAEVIALGGYLRAGLPPRDDLWVPRGAGDDCGFVVVDGRVGPWLGRGFRWTGGADCDRLAVSEPQPHYQSLDRSGRLNQMRAVQFGL